MSEASRTDQTALLAPAHPLMLRVGFAGHRATDAAALAPALAQAFALVAQAARAAAMEPVDASETVAQAHAAIWPDSVADLGLALLVGQAPGADAVATEQWRAGGYGPIQALFPYLDPAEPGRFAWTDAPRLEDATLRVALPAVGDDEARFETWTALDGAGAGAPVHNAHLEQARWLTRWADIVVVAWDGEAAGGPGGTADTVSLALHKNLPVIWVTAARTGPAGPAVAPRLLRPETMRIDSQLSELVEALASPSDREIVAPPATVEALREALLKVLKPPVAPSDDGHGGVGARHADAEAAARRAHARREQPIAPRWTGWADARGYALQIFRRGRARLAERLAPAFAGFWLWFYRSMTPGAGVRHAAAGASRPAPAPAHALIEAAFLRADELSSASGNLHRAVQLLLLATAVLAVFAGTSPALAPDLKWWAVLVEFLLLAAAALMLSSFASNHGHWSDTRRLAERLRALAATWPLGFDVADRSADQPRTWTEWQARAILRAAGPPTGAMSQARLEQALQSAFHHRDGLVAGQAAYNRSRHGRLHRLHHWVERVERRALQVLLICLALFLAIYLVVPVPKAVGNALLILSAVVPTIGAACLALDAKLGIEEGVGKARQLEQDFEELRQRFDAARDTPQQLDLLRQAAQLLMSDVDGWRDAAVRRRIWAG